MTFFGYISHPMCLNVHKLILNTLLATNKEQTWGDCDLLLQLNLHLQTHGCIWRIGVELKHPIAPGQRKKLAS